MWNFLCCFNTNHARGRFSSRQIDMIFLIFPQKIGVNQRNSFHEMSNSNFLGKKGKYFKMLSAEIFTQHAKRLYKKVFTRVMMSYYCIQIAKVKINLCMRTISSGSSLNCSCPFIYSVESMHFVSGQKSWPDWMMIKCWDNHGRNILLFISKNKRKNRERIPCLP